ncbi:MAG: hypothetical protein LBR76_06910 [Oscillospiraceae bacterium]|jgi:hypothetical protein|nr:hypothetical protein [Oscillospiraceae bacterium]
MKKVIAILLSLCFLVPVCFARSRDETLTLEQRFELSVKPGITFDILIDGLDLKTDFLLDPYGFLEALSRQPLNIQRKVVFLLVYQCHFYDYKEDFSEGLLKVSDSNDAGIIRLLAMIDTELNRTAPDYKELFTRLTDGLSAEAHGIEIYKAFIYDQYAFISRLSLYGAKWQIATCSRLAGVYKAAEKLPVLQDELAALRKDKREKTFLFEITLDNLKNEILRRIY